MFGGIESSFPRGGFIARNVLCRNGKNVTAYWKQGIKKIWFCVSDGSGILFREKDIAESTTGLNTMAIGWGRSGGARPTEHFINSPCFLNETGIFSVSVWLCLVGVDGAMAGNPFHNGICTYISPTRKPN
ncbi:MAG: hypothetical protein LBF27_06180 [Sphingobacterium sp.]|jgi:hypothetical protein|nr:hypothetical protein [Sphingobacterium sp.]